MSVTVGDHLGPYEILAPIGAGGMGEGWKARDTRLGRDVAIKISREKFSERFEREARAIAALNHPNICTLYDVGPNYLVMEFVDGAPLKGPLAWEKTVEYGKQICEALDAAHRKGIVHRDLKPGNILVTQTGVKVLDFGLAKMSAPVTGPAEATQTLPLTGQGTLLGTLQYMSPEQLEGKDADARSDIFSFGSVLYEMVTGHRAFEGKSTASILAAVMRENPRPVDEFAKDAPAGLARIITRCLKKDREARYASMADVSRDLEDCRSALAATSTGLINLKLLARWSKRPKVAVAAILILLLLAGGAGWLLQRYSGTRWAREQAIPEISRLIEEEKFTAAYALAEEAEKYIPKDANLVALWPKISRTVTIQTTPPGADIYWKDYTTPDAPWKRIG